MSKKKNKSYTGVPLPIAKINGDVAHTDLMKAATGLDVCVLPRSVLTELDLIGVDLDKDGVIQTGNKWLCVAGRAVVKAILLISNATQNAQDAERTAPVLSTLTKSLAIVAGNMSDSVIERGGQTPVASKARAFPQGKYTQININRPPEKPEPKPEIAA